MQFRVRGIPSIGAQELKGSGLDHNGQRPEIQTVTGGGNPCRHCLGLIAEGEKMLVLSYRPFNSAQPYAESGPIFLHAGPCEQYDQTSLPGWFDGLDPAIVRGYGEDHRIRYETGTIVRGMEIAKTCSEVLNNDAVAYVHVRSKFNCFQCRVDRE